LRSRKNSKFANDQDQEREGSRNNVGEIFRIRGWNSIELGKQFDNQSSHGVTVSAVQLGIGLGKRLIAAGLQLELSRK
jgi:hypothetical protein